MLGEYYIQVNDDVYLSSTTILRNNSGFYR